MGTVFQFRDAEAHRPVAEVAEVVGEILVEVVCAVHLTVDDQFQVMTDAIARCIDAILIGEACIEERCGIDGTAIDERLAVQIAIDRRPHPIVRCLLAATHGEVGILTVSLQCLVAVDGIDLQQVLVCGIADVLGYSEGDAETAVGNAVATCINDVGTVSERERLRGLVGIVHLADNGLLDIEYGDGSHPVEVVITGNMTRDGDAAASRQFLGTLVYRLAVHGVDDNRQCGQGQFQGRIAQERELLLVDDHIDIGARGEGVLSQAGSLAYGGALTAEGTEYITHELLVHGTVV